jgi:hypothetical protein
MSNYELSFHQKPVGVKGMDLDFTPNGPVFRAVTRSGLVSQQSLPHDDAPTT